jgi:hypothetical protein
MSNNTTASEAKIIGSYKVFFINDFADNGVFHVFLNGVNVVSYTTLVEVFAFIDGIENAVKAQTENKCNVTDTKTENK